MPERLQFGLLILAFSGLLAIALRYGFIGGGGGVSYRTEQPILFWIGVGVNLFILAALVVAFLASFISPGGFH